MQHVNLGPRQFPVPHPGHCRRVAGPPPVGELSPVDVDPPGPAQLLALADDTAAPVDHGSKYIKGEGLDAR